jgi:hypothetical protein
MSLGHVSLPSMRIRVAGVEAMHWATTDKVATASNDEHAGPAQVAQCVAWSRSRSRKGCFVRIEGGRVNRRCPEGTKRCLRGTCDEVTL